MSDSSVNKLDAFQDIVEPFISTSAVPVYIYLVTAITLIAILICVFRYRASKLWRQLKSIERQCHKGGSPRVAVRRISKLLSEALILPDGLQKEISAHRFGVKLPTATDVSVLLVKIKAVLSKPQVHQPSYGKTSND